MKLKFGDIFTIPITNNDVGFGQVVAFPTKSSLIIIVFEIKQKVDGNYNLENILTSAILFLGYTLDGKLYHKHWKIIGNMPVKNVEFPYNKIGIPPDDIYITDYKGKKLRECSIGEFNSLGYQTTIAPIRYENALKAYHSLQNWINEDYNIILYEKTLNSIKIFSYS